MLNIGILHYTAPPVIGGVENVLYYHATRLAMLGHRARVIAGRGANFNPEVEFVTVPQVDSNNEKMLTIKQQIDAGTLPAARFEVAVSQAVDALRPVVADLDVLIAHNVLTMNLNLPLTAALHSMHEQGALPPLVAWHHDMAWMLPRYQPLLHDGYPWDLLRRPWPGVYHVAVSVERRRMLAELYGIHEQAITVVPGGVNVEAFWSLNAEMTRLVQAIDLFDRFPVLLLPARITLRKNIEFAIRVTAALVESGLSRALLIVTGPPDPHNSADLAYFESLRSLRDQLGLQANVIFLTERPSGSPDDASMVMLFRMADALIFPSRSEGFGLPVIEAALMRMPIFCSNLAVLRETAGDIAHYFDPEGDARVVASMIRRVLEAHPTVTLRRRVLNRHDWLHIVRDQLIPIAQAHIAASTPPESA
ncbi:MAG: glycosyltransferase family 4 protein [Chloroflexota bacterium]